MFEWLNDVARWFGDLIPNWDLLEPTHGGVKFSYGGRIKVLNPGHIYWYWPAISKVETIPTKRQTMSFNQRLTTSDETTISATIVIAYEIDDVLKALVDTWDFEDTVVEVSQKLSVQPLMSRTFADSRRDLAESNAMINELRRSARTILSPYGVKVLDAYVKDYTVTKVLSHDGEGFSFNHEEEDE